MAGFDTSVLDRVLEERRKNLDEERERLLLIVQKVLSSIRNKYGIKKAYIIGSIVLAKRWNPSSDIDVAISGASSYILDVMKELEEATSYPIDVIDLDKFPYPEMIKKKGIKVYE
jgi:predicted nucleotidyltransferase